MFLWSLHANLKNVCKNNHRNLNAICVLKTLVNSVRWIVILLFVLEVHVPPAEEQQEVPPGTTVC